ncbi:hypothetical protein DU508_21110 [Pedobacter chinensis]|uniref:Uncharacterized protein n=1 Tax=Pedobacter chinensis TaxID=2282421 RepID=A0A369PQB0_9SPHI|nr:hypothetical protein DU508_21110 [Pedobacter chinensis]
MKGRVSATFVHPSPSKRGKQEPLHLTINHKLKETRAAQGFTQSLTNPSLQGEGQHHSNQTTYVDGERFDAQL